jgi:hypothetical protein
MGRKMPNVSGNSAVQAIELLIQKGVPESHIIFLNLISVSFFLYITKFLSNSYLSQQSCILKPQKKTNGKMQTSPRYLSSMFACSSRKVRWK